jgi:hypothetical protein
MESKFLAYYGEVNNYRYGKMEYWSKGLCGMTASENERDTSIPKCCWRMSGTCPVPKKEHCIVISLHAVSTVVI